MWLKCISVLSLLYLYCSHEKLQYVCDTDFVLLRRRFAVEISEQVNNTVRVLNVSRLHEKSCVVSKCYSMVRIDFIQIVQSDCELTAFSATFAIKYCTKCKKSQKPMDFNWKANNKFQFSQFSICEQQVRYHK